MNGQFKFLFGFLVLFVAGCNSRPDDSLKNELKNSESNVEKIAAQYESALDHNDALTSKIESLNRKIESLESSAVVSKSINDPIAHLFSTTWKANALATEKYSLNSQFNAKQVKNFAWSHGTNQQTTIFLVYCHIL